MPVRFVILGDVHVRTTAVVPAAFSRIVAQVPSLAPRFVVVAGDMTSGNEGDGASITKVRGWWSAFRGALGSLREAGIPVLPIAGNHDSYTKTHRDAYDEAWRALPAEIAPLVATGYPPRSYAIDVDGLHLSLLRVVDMELPASVEKWLRADLASAAARAARLRLAIGHVPIDSAMGTTATSFRRKLGSILVEGGVSAYFAGHEHLVGDAPVAVAPGRTIRQVIVGTPGASYTMPLKRSLRAAHCEGGICRLPSTGASFTIDPRTSLQSRPTCLVVVDVDGASFTVRPLALDADGRLVDFAADPRVNRGNDANA